MKKTIMLDGREMTIENNALLPRKYRHMFGRDLVVDMDSLVAGFREKDSEHINFGILEDITWLMLKAGGEDVGESVEEWLEGIDDPFAVYAIAGDVFTLWADGQKTTSHPKKK